jgi:hypothetical protein
MALDRQELIALFDRMGVDVQYGADTPETLGFREGLADEVLRLETEGNT